MEKPFLDFNAQHFLEVFNRRAKALLQGKRLIDLPIDEARKTFATLLAPDPDYFTIIGGGQIREAKALALPPIDVYTKDSIVHYSTDQNESFHIPIRLYRQEKIVGPLPILIYFHGGGFVFGDLELLDYACRYFAKHAECIVISVDYRRAPEHPFKAAHQDAYEVSKYIALHATDFGGNGLIALGGDSAGGNLATSVCHLAKQENSMRISMQILFYPWVNLNNETASDKKFKKDYYLETDVLDWMRTMYLGPNGDTKSPLANPLLQKDFTNLPQTLIILAEFDPIHDEGKEYHQKLLEAGVSSQLVEFGGILHDFCALPYYYDEALLAFDVASKKLHAVFEQELSAIV